jgi:cytochrome c-type biogenesis protein
LTRLAALTLGILACGGKASEAFRPLSAGDPAPAYAARSMAGDTVSLESLKGGPVVLNVWATWCIPCKEEMPALQQLHRQFADSGLRILGVSVDAGGADRAIRRFVEELGITFQILWDPDQRVSHTFRTIGVPETFLVDGSGRIAHRWIGQFDPMDSTTIALVRETLSRPGTE